MRITRTSLMTGVTRTLELPITPQQWAQWEGGELVQRAFPQLTAADREFIVSGMTQEEWDLYMKDDEEADNA